MRNLSYFRTERFIHDDLADRAAEMAAMAREQWKQSQTLDDYALTWPRTDIDTDDGVNLEGAVICKLPPATRAERMLTLHRMAERTKAYGIVVIERTDTAVHIWFETQHGARAWRMPLERHGDVTVLGATEVTDDGAALHILWRAKAPLN